jgi:hypothetical protein
MNTLQLGFLMLIFSGMSGFHDLSSELRIVLGWYANIIL